jgi:hypothetical protein
VQLNQLNQVTLAHTVLGTQVDHLLHHLMVQQVVEVELVQQVLY